jgi:hypothetical protein
MMGREVARRRVEVDGLVRAREVDVEGIKNERRSEERRDEGTKGEVSLRYGRSLSLSIS